MTPGQRWKFGGIVYTNGNREDNYCSFLYVWGDLFLFMAIFMGFSSWIEIKLHVEYDSRRLMWRNCKVKYGVTLACGLQRRR